MIGGGGGGAAGVRGCDAADYPRKASACEGQKLGGPKPPRFRRPCSRDSKWYMHYRLCTCTKSKY